MNVIETQEQMAQYIMSQPKEELFLDVLRQMINYHLAQSHREKLEPMSMEELNKRIDEGLEDKKAGRVYSTEEVRAYFAKKQA